jgi:hypothetical protein
MVVAGFNRQLDVTHNSFFSVVTLLCALHDNAVQRR